MAKKRVPADWFNKYSRRIEEYRLPKGEEKRNEYAALVAGDGFRLLTWIEAAETPAELNQLEKVKILQQIWEHQFEFKTKSRNAVPPGI